MEETEKSKEIIYRAPRASDAEQLMNHINKLIAEDAPIFVHGPLVTLESETKWLAGVLQDIAEKNAIYVVAESDGKVIGICSIERGSGPNNSRCHHVGEFAIGISDPNIRGKGVGHELGTRVLEGAKPLGIKLVTLAMIGSNDRAHQLYKKLGFIECGRFPKAMEYKGKLEDKLLMYKVLE